MLSPSVFICAGWSSKADSSTTVANTIPHHVVSQVLRPDVASHLPPSTIHLRSESDVIAAVSATEFIDGTPSPQSVDFLVSLKSLTSLDVPVTKGVYIKSFLASVAAQLSDRLSSLNLRHKGSSLAEGLEPVGRLRKLRVLNLSFANVRDLAPLTNLLQLRVLIVNGVPVTAVGLHAVARLPELQELYLRESPTLDDAGMAVVSTIKKLTVLDVSGADQITTTGIAALAKGRTMSRTLRKFVMTHCENVGDGALVPISRLAELRCLIVSFVDISEAIDGGLELVAGNLTHLEELDLSENEFDADVLACLISQLPKLQSLKLNQCGLDAEDFLCLSKATSLTHLDLSWCEVNVEVLTAVSTLPRLEVLGLRSAFGVDADCVAVLAKFPPCLTSLDLSECKLDEETLGLLRHIPNVRHRRSVLN